MERRARVIMVTLFLLVTAAAFLGFSRWINAPTETAETEPRAIQFQGSVSGLSVGSEARYLGVPVGRVSSIALAPSHMGRVDVVIEAQRALPPARQLVAALEAQGITGLSIIELSDRSAEDSLFAVAENVIPGVPSLIARLSDSADDITQTTDEVLEKINALLSDENLEALSKTVQQVDDMSANIANATGDLDTLVASLNRISAELELTLPDYQAMALSLDNDMVPAVVRAGEALTEASDAVADAVGSNQPQLQRLLQKDLPTLIGLTDELARSLNGINQTMGNINDEPGALLYGEQVPEVEISLE